MLVDLLLMTLIIVFIIDLSGVIDSMESVLSRWLKGPARIPKPFSCSLCMSWWCGLAYLLCVGHFTLAYVAYMALLAFLTPVFSTFMVWIRETLTWVVDKGFECLK